MPQTTRSAWSWLWPSLLLVLLLAGRTEANTEKVIFLAPEAVTVPSTHPADLRLDTLTPADWALRTHVEAQFPDASRAIAGKVSWFVLDDLSPGQRYELRICWAATQPTEFRLNTYEIETVFSTDELITSLSSYSMNRQLPSSEDGRDTAAAGPDASVGNERQVSVLLLEVLATADYFTLNQTLMDNVPPVFVDIILDPYIFNMLPRSLVPTVCYIVVVAILSWFLARSVAAWIRQVARAPDQVKKDQ